MDQQRTIRRAARSKPTMEGAGVHLRRAFGWGDVPDFDPFLLFDDFRSDDPRKYLEGFPWHPHRGIETVTYVLAGRVEHGDSMGHRGEIGAGDLQWMTAGSGIIHQEMPKGDTQGRMQGFQLWVNLPASHKMMDPRYREVHRSETPEIAQNDGVRIRVVAGMVDGVRGPVQDVVVDPEYLDVTVPPRTEFVHTTPQSHRVLAYVIEGQACFSEQKNPFSYPLDGAGYLDFGQSPWLGNHSLVLFNDGEALSVSSGEEPCRFLLISGAPLREPIAWYGPIVMNTREELEVAFQEYRNGTFLK